MSKQSAQTRAAAAAKVAEEARRREKRNGILKVVAVVAAMVVIVGICVLVGTHKGGGGKVDPTAAGADSSAYTLAVGEKSAPHTVVIYEDFLCPYCDEFERAGSTQLAQLAAQGKVYLEYRPFHFLPEDYSSQALNAFAVVLKTSGPEVAKKFHDLLYDNQPSESGPFPKMSSLVSLAVKAGADESKVKSQIEDTSSEKSWVDGATKASLAAGVQGTPTIMLDGKQFEQGTTQQDIAANLVKALS